MYILTNCGHGKPNNVIYSIKISEINFSRTSNKKVKSIRKNKRYVYKIC